MYSYQSRPCSKDLVCALGRGEGTKARLLTGPGRTPVERGGVGAASNNRGKTFIFVTLLCHRQDVLRSTFQVRSRFLSWQAHATRRCVRPSEGTDVQT